MTRRVHLLFVPLAATCTAALALVAGAARGAQAASAGAVVRPAVSLVADLAPGRESSDPRDLKAMNGTLFFTAWTPGHGRQLWKTNGTAAGTVMLTRVPGPAGADPADLTVADGVLFFSAHDPRHGRELWKSDGTVAGTIMVRDLASGRAGSNPSDITYAIGQQLPDPHNQVLVYFSARTAANGRQLWSTALYEDLRPGPAGSDPEDITPQAFFAGIEAQFAIWYFSADDGTHGREFYVAYDSDPPAEVYDIKPRSASYDPGPFDSVAGETGLLAATASAHGRELFNVQQPPVLPSLDGPQKGTATEVAGVGPGLGSNPVLGPTNQIGVTPEPEPVTRTYFAADLAGHGRRLWQADETISFSPGEIGTVGFDVNGVRLVDGTGAADPGDLTSVGGTPLFGAKTGGTEVFSAHDRGHGRQLWYSDGWSSNTHVATPVSPGPMSSDPRDITVIGQRAYFTAIDPRHGRELWKLTVPPAPQMFLDGPFGPVKTGSKVTLTATMQPAPKARPLSGRVTFYEDGAKIGVAPLTGPASSPPTASLTITAGSGNHQVVAVYSGDSHYLPATSNTSPITGD